MIDALKSRDRCGAQGELTVREALAPAMLAHLQSGRDPAEAMSLGMGGIVEIGRLLAVLAGRSDHRVEQTAIAFLRGALRGAAYPVHNNGRAFMRATDA